MDDYSWLPHAPWDKLGFDLLQTQLSNAISLSGWGGAITPYMLYRAGVDVGEDPDYMAQQTLPMVSGNWFPGDADVIRGLAPDPYGSLGRINSTWIQRFADWRAQRRAAPITAAEIERAAELTNVPLEERAIHNAAEVAAALEANTPKQPEPAAMTMLSSQPLDLLAEPLPSIMPVLTEVPATEQIMQTVAAEQPKPLVRPVSVVNQAKVAQQTAPAALAAYRAANEVGASAALDGDPAVSAGVSNIGLIIAGGAVLAWLMLKKKRLA